MLLKLHSSNMICKPTTSIRGVQYVSRLFQPLTMPPKGDQNSPRKSPAGSKSRRLMCDMGIIRPSSPGMFHVLPLGFRAIDKLTNLVKHHMSQIGAQQINIPFLIDAVLWRKSGRWESTTQEIFKLKDRHGNDYILSPTNEESAADLIASIPDLSVHQLPILIFGISNKFRDELKPRCGFFRGREFVMKDLYSFDSSENSAQETYDLVSQTYTKILNELGLRSFRVAAEPGDFGGSVSHEFQVPCNIGEDVFNLCENCGQYSIAASEVCDICKDQNIREIKCLEVGHTFALGTKYTKPLGAVFTSANGATQPLVMGSFGLGLSRILAACIETLSLEDEIRWPQIIAPYQIVIITPKAGSKESSIVGDLHHSLYTKLNQIEHLNDEIIIDDRVKMTIGRRLVLARKTGYPFIVVIGSKATLNPPIFELINVCQNTTWNFTFDQLISFFSQKEVEKIDSFSL